MKARPLTIAIGAGSSRSASGSTVQPAGARAPVQRACAAPQSQVVGDGNGRYKPARSTRDDVQRKACAAKQDAHIVPIARPPLSVLETRHAADVGVAARPDGSRGRGRQLLTGAAAPIPATAPADPLLRARRARSDRPAASPGVLRQRDLPAVPRALRAPVAFRASGRCAAGAAPSSTPTRRSWTSREARAATRRARLSARPTPARSPSTSWTRSGAASPGTASRGSSGSRRWP